MSSSLSDVSLTAIFQNTSNQLSRYLGIFIFVGGVVGNILNTLVLSQKSLRSNPCAWLFLVSSIANFVALLAAVPSRFLSTWAADLTNTNQFLCKLRVFIFFGSMTVGFWLIALATVDRWLLSSIHVNRRQKSTLKNAQLGTVLIVVLSTATYVQLLYCYEANMINTPTKCFSKTLACRFLTDISFALITILFPLQVMITFGLKTISNVHRVQSRLQPVNATVTGHVNQNISTTVSGPQFQRKKTDRQLLIMLLIQVLLAIILTSPIAIFRLYLTLTVNIVKSSSQNTIETFISNFFFLLSFAACAMPFYVYTLSGGSVFRKAFFSLVKILGRNMICRRG